MSTVDLFCGEASIVTSQNGQCRREHKTKMSDQQDIYLIKENRCGQRTTRSWQCHAILLQKARLNSFNICFNLHSTLCWTKCSVRLNRSFNIVENVKVVESLLKACWIKFKLVLTFIQHRSNFTLFSKMLNGPFRRFQHLPNMRSTVVERMLVKCWNRLNRAGHPLLCSYQASTLLR